MTRKEHLEQLIQELDAKVEYTASRYEMQVDTLGRVLYLAPWDEVPEEEVYWVGLHELGHLALTDENDPAHIVGRLDDLLNLAEGFEHWGAEREARAWVWALDHAKWPRAQAAESSIAWGLADRMYDDYRIDYGLRRIFEELGDDPDWYFNVTTPEHYEKLNGYARPRWARFVQRIQELEPVRVTVDLPRASDASGVRQTVQDGARLPRVRTP